MTCIYFSVQAEIVFSNITAETKDVTEGSGMTDFSNTTVITAETIALTLGVTEQLATATKTGIEELESIFPRDLNTTNYVLDNTIDLLIRSLGEKVYIHVCVHSQTIISLHNYDVQLYTMLYTSLYSYISMHHDCELYGHLCRIFLQWPNSRIQ